MRKRCCLLWRRRRNFHFLYFWILFFFCFVFFFFFCRSSIINTPVSWSFFSPGHFNIKASNCQRFSHHFLRIHPSFVLFYFPVSFCVFLLHFVLFFYFSLSNKFCSTFLFVIFLFSTMVCDNSSQKFLIHFLFTIFWLDSLCFFLFLFLIIWT